MLSDVEEYIFDELESESEDTPVKREHLSERERKILELGLEFVTNVLQAHISTTLLALIDKYDEKEFESRKQQQDKVYQSLQLVPDMTLVDEEGYNVGTIKSVDNEAKTAVVVIAGDETEKTMSFDDVLTYTIFQPCPLSTTYLKDKKIKHYRFGGDKEIKFVVDEFENIGFLFYFYHNYI